MSERTFHPRPEPGCGHRLEADAPLLQRTVSRLHPLRAASLRVPCPGHIAKARQRNDSHTQGGIQGLSFTGPLAS